MTLLAIVLCWLGVGCLLFALALQLDVMEVRWERRNRERAEHWEANRRGSARVVDFKTWKREQVSTEEPADARREA